MRYSIEYKKNLYIIKFIIIKKVITLNRNNFTKNIEMIYNVDKVD